MTPDEWIAEFAARLGVSPPDPGEVDALLELAGIAAHSSARTAAPVACWLVARAGRPPRDCLDLASEIAEG